MEVQYLRASSINAYEDCPFKYWLDYSCGLQSAAGKKALLGTCVHSVAEILAKAKMTGHDKLEDKYTNVDYLLQICWNRHTTENPQFKYEPADFTFCKKQIDNIMKSKYNPLNLNIIAIEKQFDIELNAPGFGDPPCRLRGTMDLVIELDENTIGISDYKTGERKSWITGQPKEFEDFEEDTQLLVYNLALSVLYPQYKYRILTLLYTRDGGPFSIPFGPDAIDKTINLLRKKYNEIKSDNLGKRLLDDNLRKSEFWKCKYVCHYGKTKENGVSLCDKYNQILDIHGMKQAKEKIVKLTVGKNEKLSRRNDYSRAKIETGTLR